MILKIDSIVKSKEPKGECILLEGLKDTNLQGFAIIAETEEKNTHNASHLFKFPEWQVKQGDYVRIYTGLGTPKTKRNLLESKTHFFYWENESSFFSKKAGNIELVQYKSENK